MDKRGIDFQVLEINMFWCYAADRDTQTMRLQRYRPDWAQDWEQYFCPWACLE
jgi:hypothetical protein